MPVSADYSWSEAEDEVNGQDFLRSWDQTHSLKFGLNWEREKWNFNVSGVFLTVQALLPALRAAGGKIAVISSQMGSSEKASGGSYIYRASKAASANLARNLAADLRGDGIAVAAFHPGWVRTDMGGSSAAISPEESATGLVAEIEALSLANTGAFLNWDGRPHPF